MNTPGAPDRVLKSQTDAVHQDSFRVLPVHLQDRDIRNRFRSVDGGNIIRQQAEHVRDHAADMHPQLRRRIRAAHSQLQRRQNSNEAGPIKRQSNGCAERSLAQASNCGGISTVIGMRLLWFCQFVSRDVFHSRAHNAPPAISCVFKTGEVSGRTAERVFQRVSTVTLTARNETACDSSPPAGEP